MIQKIVDVSSCKAITEFYYEQNKLGDMTDNYMQIGAGSVWRGVVVRSDNFRSGSLL